MADLWVIQGELLQQSRQLPGKRRRVADGTRKVPGDRAHDQSDRTTAKRCTPITPKNELRMIYVTSSMQQTDYLSQTVRNRITDAVL
jgi:hypothetical protein